MPQQDNQAAATQNLQRYLLQLSYHDDSIPPPPVDGIFDRDTEAALRAFQSGRELPVTGIADRITWEELYNSYRASLAANTPPRAVSLLPFTNPPTVLSLGLRAFAVGALQQMLRELSVYYSELARIVPSGLYDEETASAVRDFQMRNRLPVTGEVDPATWNAIADQYNILFAAEPYV